MATLDEVLKQVNDLTILVNSITTASENIEDFPLLDPINDAAELPATFNGADYKVNVSQLVKDYLEGLNISIENDTISTVLDPSFTQVQFSTVASPPPYSPGLMWWDGTNWNFYDNVEGTSLQGNKELVLDAYNNNGTSFDNFTVVNNGGVVNGVTAVKRALADTVANAEGLAVITAPLAVGELGKVVYIGEAGGDTSMWNVNDKLFLSSTVPGALTNVEQPILSYVGRVLVADTAANGGKILVAPRGVANITAIGQSSGAGTTQDITTTPQPITAYLNNAFELNTTVTHTGTTNLTTSISPVSIGASGYYRMCFNVTLSSTDNDLLTFEAYLNGTPTGLLCNVDLRNNNIDAGGDSINAISQNIITDTDNVEIYCYNDGGTSTVTYTAVTFNIERIGNV